MSTETLGQLLRRLRRARLATVCYRRGPEFVALTGPMSQNELARRAGLDSALVHRIEAGQREQVRRVTVESLAAALDADAVDAARLLIAAGYWPWPDMDDADRERIIGDVVRIKTVEASPFIRRRTG